MKFYSIGVYNSTEEEYFAKLIDNRIDTFCDIRQRRGVRGAKYAFVNSIRLQEKLCELDIRYGHVVKLAPTTEIRNLQKQHDAEIGVAKSKRTTLGEVFKNEYESRIIDNFNFDNLVERLDEIGAENIVFFCVEEQPAACHRSIVTDKLASLGFEIEHI